jgi:precorrin-6B methylase 2
MRLLSRVLVCALLVGVSTLAVDAGLLAQTQAPPRSPDVIFVPTPDEVINAMLKAAGVTKNDVVYDLGCGDGRIVVAAAKLGARVVGVDIDPVRVKEARANIEKNGVGDRARIIEGDLFTVPISEASVVTLYLLPSLNVKLRPRLWKELRVGSRVVSHAFDMDTWKPDQTLDVDGRQVFFWRITEQHKK